MRLLYETDFYAWTLEQSQLLKKGDFSHLDIANLVEEIESLGKQQRQELWHRLGILIGHCLKWDYQPELLDPGFPTGLNDINSQSK